MTSQGSRIERPKQWHEKTLPALIRKCFPHGAYLVDGQPINLNHLFEDLEQVATWYAEAKRK